MLCEPISRKDREIIIALDEYLTVVEMTIDRVFTLVGDPEFTAII